MGQRGKEAKIVQRREQIADLYIRGFTQCAIARELGISQPTVSNDLKVIQEGWKKSAIRDFDAQREKELRKLDRIELEAWAAWERSQQPSQSARVNGTGGDSRSEKVIKNRYGDARFLDQVNKCISQRCALLGLNEPIKAAVATINLDLTPEQRKERLAQILTQVQERRAANEAGNGKPQSEPEVVNGAAPTSPALSSMSLFETTALIDLQQRDLN